MLEYLFAGVALGLTSGISPGPILALVITQTLRYGRREGILVSFAPLISDLPIVAVAILVLSRFPGTGPLMGAISIAGAVFLALLGFESFRAQPPSPTTQGGEPRSLLKAVTLNFLNPHVYLFWITVGAPFVLRGSAKGIAPPAAFLAAFYFFLVGSKVVVAILLSRARNLLTGKGYVRALRALAGLMFVLAAWLLIDGLRRLEFVWPRIG